MPPVLREILGRSALALIGLPFLYVGWKYSSILPTVIALPLLLLGALLVLVSLIPLRWIEQLLGRQTNNSLHDNDSVLDKFHYL